MTQRFIKTYGQLPKDIHPVAPTEGTRAYEYLSGTRILASLMDDPMLRLIVDDKHPEGGMIYVFKDHSSVVYAPVVH
jgi:hypothetical protein